MATNSYGWASPNVQQQQQQMQQGQQQYSSDMALAQGSRALPSAPGSYGQGSSPSYGTGMGMNQAAANQNFSLQQAQQANLGAQNQGMQRTGYGPQSLAGVPRGTTSGFSPSNMSMPGQSGGLQGYGIYSGDRTGQQQPRVGTGPTTPTSNGQMPDYGATPFQYSPQTSNDFLQKWASGWNGDLSNAGKYGDENFRNLAEGYANYYAIPYLNSLMADRTQGFNEAQFGANFNETQRVNNLQYGLAQRGSDREDASLKFAMDTNARDFTEGQRQFNQTLGQNQYGLETNRMGVNNQLTLGLGQNQNEARRIANDLTLGQGQLALGGRNADITAQNNAWNYALGQGANANEATQIANQFALGKGANANQLLDINNQFALGKQQNANQQFANQTGRMDVQNQFTLGKEQNANTLTGLNQQYALGLGQNATAAAAQQALAQFQQGQNTNQAYANTTGRMDVQNQFTLGQGQLANQQAANAAQLERYRGQNANEQFANQTALTGVQNQYSLGQGQLGLGNRQLDVQSAYQQQQLAQQAALAREQMRNDLIQSRLQATGRVSGPNNRAVRSWY